MKISDKVTILWFAFDGLYYRQRLDPELHREHIQMLHDYQREIEDYLEQHLPLEHKQYGSSVIKEVESVSDKIFKQTELPPKHEMDALIGRLLLTASFIPQNEQDV